MNEMCQDLGFLPPPLSSFLGETLYDVNIHISVYRTSVTQDSTFWLVIAFFVHIVITDFSQCRHFARCSKVPGGLVV